MLGEAEDAIDLPQGFFAHLLAEGLVRRADPDRGRFRSFLLGCVKRYLSGQGSEMKAIIPETSPQLNMILASHSFGL